MTEITSRKNPLIVRLKKLGADGDFRRACGEFLCDGAKLLREAVQTGADIRAVLVCGQPPEWLPKHVPVYAVPRDIIESVSPLKNPQNIIFSCAIPALDAALPAKGPVVILEDIQDPGNAGTVLRTADAFGIGAVLFTGSCVDPWHPKTIRATMGAIFRQRIAVSDFDDIAGLKARGMRLFGAALGAGSKDIRELPLLNAAVVIGSEGHGLSDKMLSLCDDKLLIPMSPASESLNAAVAAAIVMWEMKKGTL
jgi:TrmH family RNA methyltransferase